MDPAVSSTRPEVTMNQASETFTVHVSGPRPTLDELTKEVLDVIAAIPLFLCAPLVRHWHGHWGATAEEVAASLPGDDLVPGCQYVATRAISIDAAPECVWPWLAQIGFGKAGFYSNDLLDNAGHPSARHIIDELQQPQIGDWIPMYKKVNDTTAFRIAALKPGESILWVKPDSTWVWTLAARGSGTRLVTRLRILYRWNRPAEAGFSLLLNEFGDYPMMRKMLLGIKRRAEHFRH
jgi:hypothetical protein